LGFEQRIQERRFRALLESTQAALDAGDGDTARHALDEARELRPEALELVRLGERIDGLPAVIPATGFLSYLHSRASGAVSMLLVGIALLIGIDWWRSADPVVDSAPPVASGPVVSAQLRLATPVTVTPAPPPARAPAPLAPVKMVDRVPEPIVDRPVTKPVASTGFANTRLPAAVEPPLPAAIVRPAFRAPSLPEPASFVGEVPDNYVAPQSPRGSEPLALGTSTRGAGLQTAPPLSSGAQVANVTRQPASIASMTSVTASAPPPAAAATSAVASRTDETSVAQVLNQYARAYGQLDAGAARAVWPSVNERALARAFAGLASQDVSFDNCDIDVRGAIANASCRGHAKYVGKIGSREERTESRQWRFELRRDGDAWKIETAEARRLAYQDR
jgi:hypothetical protein